MSLIHPSWSTPVGGLVMYRLPHHVELPGVDTLACWKDLGFVTPIHDGVYGEAECRAQHHLGGT